MLPNPFNKPLLPLSETDHEKNTDLVRQLLGAEKAAEFASLIQGGNTSRAANPTLEDLRRQAAAALENNKDILQNAKERIFALDIQKQFQKQTELLTDLSLLESKDGVLGITAIDNNFYPVPTVEQVTQYFTRPDKIDFFLKKKEQGFTKLQITPIGRPLTSFQTVLERELRKHKTEDKLLDRKGKPLDLDTNQPVWTIDEIKNADTAKELLYFPTTFDPETPINGITKQELLTDSTQPFPGYRITFLQENLTIPRAGAGEETNGRPALEAGLSSEDYFKQLQDPESPYFQEQGLTLEDWCTLFLTNLHTTNTVLDNYQNNTDSVCYLLAMRLKSGAVLDARWGCYDLQVNVSRGGPASVDANYGLRVAVG